MLFLAVQKRSGFKDWLQYLCEANIRKNVTMLRSMAPQCSERERAILATALREMETKGIDATRTLTIIQVDAGLYKRKTCPYL